MPAAAGGAPGAAAADAPPAVGKGEGAAAAAKPDSSALVAYQLTLPKGSPLPPEVVGKVGEVAKNLGLNQEQAQKLLELQHHHALTGQQAQSAALARQAQEWESALKADRELGGAHYESTVAAARDAFARFGTPELKAAIDAAGYGNFPPLVRFAAAIGKAMREDSFAGGGSGPTQPGAEQLLKVRYPSMGG